MIRGELVNLRAVERDDLAAIHSWLNDPAVMLGWGWSAVARSRHDVAAQIEEWLARESHIGRPAALIVELLDGAPAGLVIMRDERPEARSVELSLLVGDPACWGQGIGADMLQTILEACFAGWGVHRVGVRVDAGNARAVALYQRHGFIAEGRLREAAFVDGQHADILLFSILASAWRRGNPAKPPVS